MFQDAFVKLSRSETETILGNVEPELEGSRFESDSTTIMAYDFSFYPGYRFLEIIDHEQNPPAKRSLVYKPEDITILDWTNEPIYALNERAPIKLNRDNVVEYVHFFFSHVRGRHGIFNITESVDDIVWVEEPPVAARKAIGDRLTPVSVTGVEKNGTFNLEMCVMFKDSLFKNKARVKIDGSVKISDEELIIEDVPVRDDILER